MLPLSSQPAQDLSGQGGINTTELTTADLTATRLDWKGDEDSVTGAGQVQQHSRMAPAYPARDAEHGAARPTLATPSGIPASPCPLRARQRPHTGVAALQHAEQARARGADDDFAAQEEIAAGYAERGHHRLHIATCKQILI